MFTCSQQMGITPTACAQWEQMKADQRWQTQTLSSDRLQRWPSKRSHAANHLFVAFLLCWTLHTWCGAHLRCGCLHNARNFVINMQKKLGITQKNRKMCNEIWGNARHVFRCKKRLIKGWMAKPWPLTLQAHRVWCVMPQGGQAPRKSHFGRDTWGCVTPPHQIMWPHHTNWSESQWQTIWCDMGSQPTLRDAHGSKRRGSGMHRCGMDLWFRQGHSSQRMLLAPTKANNMIGAWKSITLAVVVEVLDNHWILWVASKLAEGVKTINNAIVVAGMFFHIDMPSVFFCRNNHLRQILPWSIKMEAVLLHMWAD